MAPHPLPLYQSLAALSTLSLASAWPQWSNVSTAWNNASPPWKTLSAEAVNSFAAQRWAAFQKGLAKLAAMPPLIAEPTPHRVVWQAGSACLRFYPPSTAPQTPPLLLVPSLINTARIFDLSPEVSFIRYMTARGTPVYLLDWGSPSAAEHGFSCSDYVTERLLPALQHVPEKPVLLGYCMGGLLAAAAAQLAGEAAAGLIMLAAPWDFSKAAPPGLKVYLRVLEPLLSAKLQEAGLIPPAVLQALVLTLDPFAVVDKYINFAKQDDAAADRQFQHIEQWLADGVPLSKKVLREALFDWYLGNAPCRGGWRVASTIITPDAITVPCYIVAPQRDRIVPPAAALAFAPVRATVSSPATGHIGMVAGRSSLKKVWEPLHAWLQQL